MPLESESTSSLLERWRADVGDGEFGYRAQAMFAETLQRIGASILAINNQGHPDIVARLGRQLARIEVEICPKNQRFHTVKIEDILSISPRSSGDCGLLALLDIAEPTRWAVIQHDRAVDRIGRRSTSSLHAIADRSLSEQCNLQFADLIRELSPKWTAMTYHLLCERALRVN